MPEAQYSVRQDSGCCGWCCRPAHKRPHAPDLPGHPLGGLKALKTLDLSGTLLSSLDFRDFHFESLKLVGCKELKSLVLSGQNELKRLDLSGCAALAHLEHVKFKQLTALEYLNISECTEIFKEPTLPEDMRTLKDTVLHPDNDFSKHYMMLKDAKENGTAAFVASVLAATGATALGLAASCENDTFVLPGANGTFSVSTVCIHHVTVKGFKFVWLLSTLFALVGLFTSTRLQNELSDTQNVYYARRIPDIVVLLPELCVLFSTAFAYVGVTMVVRLFDFALKYQIVSYIFVAMLGVLGLMYVRPKWWIRLAVYLEERR